MQWDYGRLNGQPIAWNVFWWRELIEFSVWGAVFFFGIKYFEKIINNSIAILVVTLLSVLCFFPFKYNEQLKSVTVYDERSSARFERDPAKRFVLSKKKNIIMLVLDGFGDQLFQEILKEKPGLEKDLDGFVRFPQMLGVGGYTIYSTATYLGGEPYLNKTDINTYRRNLFGKGNSLYRQMADKGWKNGHHHSFSFNTFFRFNPHTPELLDNVTLSSDGNVLDQNSMLAISIFSSSPQSLKRFFYSLFGLETQWDTETVIEEAASPQIVNLPPLPGNHADVKFMNDMMKHVRVSEDGPVFKYYHILGVHHPNTIDRNLKPVESSSAKEVGLADVILVKRFIEILKEAGCYDNSQIYIMADHGLYPITSSMETAKKLMTEVYPKRTSTLFLFKDYGSSGSLRTNNLRLTYEDFSEIITTLADMKPGTDTRQALKSLERNERSFHTFSNMGGKFYPTIIRMKVKGDSRNPANWSIDRLFFAIEEGEPLGDGDSFKFAKLEEYGGYIVNGIIGTGTYTRGTVDFALPLDSALKGKSVKVTLNIAPAITPGVKARFYEVKATRKLIAKGSLTSLKYKNISFSVPPTAQENGVLKFSLIPLNTTPGATKEVSTGKYLRSPSFKLNKISIDVSKK